MDQFNNAMQTMWSNALDSDMVKGIVALGTEVIKIIDKIGLLNTALIAIATISMIKNKMGPIAFLTEMSNMLRGLPQQIGNLFARFTGLTAATSAYTAETLSASVANGALSASEAANIATKNGLTMATTSLTAAEAAEMLTKGGMTEADALALVSKLGLSETTTALTAETVKATMANAGYTPAQISAANAALFGAGANGTLAASFTALWAAMWPVLVVMLAIGAAAAVIYGVVKLIDKLVVTTEELQEELTNFKSELSSVQSELQEVNSELKTTTDRISELLAKDKLSFMEKEELETLQAANALLESRQFALEAEEERKKQEVASAAADALNSKMEDPGADYKLWKHIGHTIGGAVAGAYVGMTAGGMIGTAITSGLGTVAGTIIGGVAGGVAGGFGSNHEYKHTRETVEESLDNEIKSYKDSIAKRTELEAELSGLSGKEYDKKKKEIDKLDKEIAKSEDFINSTLAEMGEILNGVEYGYGADDALDTYYNTLFKNQMAHGVVGSKTAGIKHILNRPEHKEALDAINVYAEALKNGDKEAEEAIRNIIANNEALQTDINSMGLNTDEIVEYFSAFGTEANYKTVEGKIKETTEASRRLAEALSKDLSEIGFVDADGNIMSDAIAEYFGGEGGGISEEARAEIERLVKQIRDGKLTVEDALKEFELFSVQSTLDIYIGEVQTNFKDVFVDLEEADGLIDTFKELGEAISSAAGALETFNQAEAEMAYGGQVSIETALKLMEYTDDYGSVLEVVDGKLRLADGAEEALIDTRIDSIKISAQAALEDAKLAQEKAWLAVEEYKAAMQTEGSTKVVAKAWDIVLAKAAGFAAGIKSLFTDQSWSDAYNAAYDEAMSKVTEYETQYSDAGLQALIDEAKKADNDVIIKQGNADLAQKLTKDNLEAVFDSGTASGGANNTEEVAENAFQKEMDYWENRIAANQAKYEQIQSEIDLLEAKGQKADASFYEEQIKLENERLWLLDEQKKAALVRLKEIEAAGGEGSEQWWEVAGVLNDIESKLDDVTASIVDLQDAIGEIDNYKFEEFNNRLDDLTGKLETIRNLIAPNGEEDWFDEEGNWTEAGVAVLGAHIQELEFDEEGLKKAQEELDKYSFSYSGNETYYESLGIHSEQEYYDKVEELTDQQYQFAESISDTKQSIVDMYENSIDAVEEYIDTLVDSYSDYIDSVKEALDAERDLYDFKKNVQKQTKDIASLERRIASLSGSTNAADIAERRKLEAQLYESRESLNDTYYDHAKDAQSDALDAEAQAYEESMTSMIEGLRASLEEATSDMDEFLMGVTSMVMYNADTILVKYQETNLPLTEALTNPWEEAIGATDAYSGNALDLMNQWMQDGGFFSEFSSIGTTSLESPWSAGADAANTFKDSVSTVMSGVVSNIELNVKRAKDSLSSLTDVITTTTVTSGGSVGESYSGNTGGYVSNTGGSAPTMHEDGKNTTKIAVGKQTDAKDSNKKTVNGVQYYLWSDGYYYPMSAFKFLNFDYDERGKKTSVYGFPAGTKRYKYYAKGTTGTGHNQWAMTDEFGDELVLVPGKNGNLSFMRKGTGVVPADLTANLMEWGQITPDSLSLGGGVNVNMINNAVIKPQYDFSFDSLVHVDNCSQETLKDLEKMVDNKIDKFSKELNYSIKRFAR